MSKAASNKITVTADANYRRLILYSLISVKFLISKRAIFKKIALLIFAPRFIGFTDENRRIFRRLRFRRAKSA